MKLREQQKNLKHRIAVSLLEKEIARVCEESIAIGYRPSYFIRMVKEKGVLLSVRQVLLGSNINPPKGFLLLWEKKRLDLSVEYIARKPVFQSLFTPQMHQNAKERLELFGV